MRKERISGGEDWRKRTKERRAGERGREGRIVGKRGKDRNARERGRWRLEKGRRRWIGLEERGDGRSRRIYGERERVKRVKVIVGSSDE